MKRTKLSDEERQRRDSERHREYRAKGFDKRDSIRNPKSYLLHVAKRRAKRNNIEFDITREDIHIPEQCPILGIKLGTVRQPFSDRESSPSLDRVDPTKGYTKDNIRVISFRANRHKSDMTLEDIERLYQYTKGLL